MNQVKVLHVLYGGNIFGGVENFLLQYYSHMDRSKVHFDFAFCIGNSMSILADDNALKESKKIVLAPRIHNKWVTILIVYFHLKKFLKKNKYDYVHINTGNIGIQVACLLASKHADVTNRIAHSHSSGSLLEKKGIRYWLYNQATKIVYNNSTLKAACSESAGRHIFGTQLSQGNLKIIPIAVDPRKFVFNSITRMEYRNNYGIQNNELVFILVGNFTLNKNHLFAIKVFNHICKKTDACKLWFVGTGELYETLQKEVTSYGLDDKVVFMGYRQDVPSLMQAADCLLLPSKWEGFPTVVLEAQSADLKCICNDTITREVKVTDNCFFIPLETDKWVTECLKPVNVRCNTVDRIVSAGYDIMDASKALQDYYIDHKKKDNCGIRNK